MISALLKGIFKIIIYLVNLLLTPIDLLIDSALPSVSTGINYINNLIDYVINFFPFIKSWFNLPALFIELIVAYYTFKLTIPLAIHTIKLAIKWYDKIKP